MKPSLKECPNQSTPYLYADSVGESKRFIIKARCKLWNCPYCGAVNAHQHKIRILNGINELRNQGHQFSFVTVTSHERQKTTDGCLSVWRNAWKRLRERLRRIHKNNKWNEMVFAITTEFHKNGRLHWHILINNTLSTRWWKDNSRACGLGYQCKSAILDSAIQGANYVTKYLTKSMAEANFPKKMRRIVYSQTFPDKPIIAEKLNWQILPPKESILDCIRSAWSINLDAYLNWNEISEIVYDEPCRI